MTLREAGHDVGWVRTDSPGPTVTEVLARAVMESRILLTFDKDFGELAWRSKLPSQCGIVLFRMSMPSAKDVGASFVKLLSSRDDWAGHFTVVEMHRIRMRALPQ